MEGGLFQHIERQHGYYFAVYGTFATSTSTFGCRMHFEKCIIVTCGVRSFDGHQGVMMQVDEVNWTFSWRCRWCGRDGSLASAGDHKGPPSHSAPRSPLREWWSDCFVNVHY